jgi:hypothetical protein
VDSNAAIAVALAVVVAQLTINLTTRRHNLSHLNLNYSRCLIFITAIVAISGCNGSESTQGGDEKWLEVPEALIKFGSPDTSCEAVINDLREAVIINPNPDSSEFQMMVSPCSKADLEFGKAVRCKLGRLQVKCL